MNSLNSIDTHELVLSKENIQPLRRGRDASILCAALQAETDTQAHQEIEKQRNEFEIRLRSNTSEDPLTDWCDYINWIEQSFFRQAREGKLNVVLQKCINKFKDCEKYKNDVRFVKICIKYADLGENTVELLSQIHRHGIGTSCAELYITWAEKYAVDNCFKKANAIYERGLKCSAQPIQLLQDAYKNFQAFLVRKMLNEKETFQPTMFGQNAVEEVRQPYNVLQTLPSGQKEVVPNVRIGANVVGTGGTLQLANGKNSKPKNNQIIKVFEDPENSCSSVEPKFKLEKVPSKKTITKENTVKPGVWTNKNNKHVPFSVQATSVPFEVHRDNEEEKQQEKSEVNKKTRAAPSSVLKSHKPKFDYEDENFASAPLFYPEPYDPSKLSMYCKDMVYAGGLEFQFEELRAIQYRKKKEETFKTTINSTQKVSSTSLSKEVQELEPASEIGSEIGSHSKPVEEKSDVKSKEGIIRKINKEGKKHRKSLFSTASKDSGPLKLNLPTEPEISQSTDYSMNQTIHTKEALSEMQQLWFSKPASPIPLVNKPTKSLSKSILKPSKPCFSLYVDESCLENVKPLEGLDKPLDLTMNSRDQDSVQRAEKKLTDGTSNDENRDVLNPPGGVRKKTTKLKPPIENCKENMYIPEEELAKVPKIISDFELDDEDKENGIPNDYCGPVGKSNRKVSGILTPAENIEIAQLSDEEVEIDEFEVEDEDLDEGAAQDFSSIMQCNNTAITETWNFTKGFQFPRGESTPNVRKSLHFKEECNESIFEAENGTVKPKSKEAKNEKPKEKLSSGDKGPLPGAEGENFPKNLSVIAETSREYRSSSSGSSGASTLALRSSKNFPYTPSEGKSIKCSFTSSQTTLFKTKVQSYTGYEASSELSSFKSPAVNKDRTPMNTTLDLMTKLNAIESLSLVDTSKDVGREDSSQLKNENIEKQEGEIVNPFCENVINKLLEKMDFPKEQHTCGYFLLHNVDMEIPEVGNSITLGAHDYKLKKLIRKDSCAETYKLENNSNKSEVIAKFQKPPSSWEFYITREVLFRIQDKNLSTFLVDVESAYFFKNVSVLLTKPVGFGDLLSLINKMIQEKMVCQLLAMFFTCQILQILESLHSCNIIHGQIKPENFLLRFRNDKPQLQLINFEKSVDTSLFSESTKFQGNTNTSFDIMLRKPWTYEIDLYGLANCGHYLLFGENMKVMEKDGVWSISRVIPRYWAKTEWKNFFENLLNVENSSKLPNLKDLRESFESVLEESSEFELSLFKLQNLFKS